MLIETNRAGAPFLHCGAAHGASGGPRAGPETSASPGRSPPCEVEKHLEKQRPGPSATAHAIVVLQKLSHHDQTRDSCLPRTRKPSHLDVRVARRCPLVRRAAKEEGEQQAERLRRARHDSADERATLWRIDDRNGLLVDVDREPPIRTAGDCGRPTNHHKVPPIRHPMPSAQPRHGASVAAARAHQSQAAASSNSIVEVPLSSPQQQQPGAGGHVVAQEVSPGADASRGVQQQQQQQQQQEQQEEEQQQEQQQQEQQQPAASGAQLRLRLGGGRRHAAHLAETARVRARDEGFERRRARNRQRAGARHRAMAGRRWRCAPDVVADTRRVWAATDRPRAMHETEPAPGKGGTGSTSTSTSNTTGSGSGSGSGSTGGSTSTSGSPNTGGRHASRFTNGDAVGGGGGGSGRWSFTQRKKQVGMVVVTTVQ